MVGPNDVLTEHQHNWWGIQKCRRCNPLGVAQGLRPHNIRPHCPDCDGSGWTEWAALATEPWTEIIPRLWVGGHDYNDPSRLPNRTPASAIPESEFSLTISMYHRAGFEPRDGEHIQFLFGDSALTHSVKRMAHKAAKHLVDAHSEGGHVLSRCQAGLNRSSLVAGLALIRLGFSGDDAVQLIRSKRSPWALCNDDYAEYLSKGATEDLREGLE